jgi:hypothetical protein
MATAASTTRQARNNHLYDDGNDDGDDDRDGDGYLLLTLPRL